MEPMPLSEGSSDSLPSPVGGQRMKLIDFLFFRLFVFGVKFEDTIFIS